MNDTNVENVGKKMNFLVVLFAVGLVFVVVIITWFAVHNSISTTPSPPAVSSPTVVSDMLPNGMKVVMSDNSTIITERQEPVRRNYHTEEKWRKIAPPRIVVKPARPEKDVGEEMIDDEGLYGDPIE